MRIAKLILLFVFLSSQSFFCQASDETASIDISIVNHTYNFEFDSADELLDAQLEKYPDSPKYYFLRIGTELIKSMKFRDAAKVVDKQGVSDSLNKYSVEFAEAAIEKFEDMELGLEDKFFLGCIYGYIGRIYGLQSSWMSAFSSVKSGKNILEEVLEKDNSYYDAYIVLGMLNYFADRMSGITGFIAGILGLSGDRETGLEYLKLTSEKGYLNSAQATYLLIELYTRLESNEFAAFPYFEKFTKEYPKNSHMMNWYGRELLDVNMPGKVADLIENDKYKVIDDYVFARYYHEIGEYELSNDHIERIMKRHEYYYNHYYDHAMFIYSLNNLMLGNVKTAKSYVKNLHEPYNIFAEELINNSVQGIEFINFKRLVSLYSDKDKIEEIIKSNPQFGNPQIISGLFDFYKGVYYFKSGKYKIAEKLFDGLRSDEAGWLSIESSKYLIEIYTRTNVSVEKVENLVDYIDDLDVERLVYRAKDLEKKYNL